MKKKATLFAFALVLTLSLITGNAAENYDYDVAIRGGTLYLGGFEMGGTGDIAISGDRIVAVGKAPGRAAKEIDASGMIVSPGFIDLHTHTEYIYQLAKGLLNTRSIKANMNYITQGVTTVVSGNCGAGYSSPEEISAWLDRIDRMPFGTNVIHLVPHGDIRLMAMGEGQADREDPAPTPEELESMKELVRQGMEAGAYGMSTGLEYDPGARADTDELVELAKVVAELGGVYTSHTRQEGPDPDKMMASYGEAIEVGERAGLPVQISHIKCSGKTVHGMSDQVIKLVKKARERGVKVFADQYPYPAGSTTLSRMVPVKYRDREKVMDRYCTKEGRKIIYDDVARVLEDELPPETVLVSLAPFSPWNQNKTLDQIAGDRDPVEVAIDLACGPVGVGIYFSQNEEDVKNFMKEDWVATGSDGATFHKWLRYTHPRFYGTFPRKIREYVYEEKVITLPHALRSMTELPAEAWDIKERGKLEAGGYADVVVFDPDTIRDNATFEKPTVFSDGIEYLLVNGVITISGGKYTGDRGGRAIRLIDTQ